MTDIHSATVQFKADTRDFDKGFNKVSKSMSGIEESVDRVAESITQKIGSAIAAIGAIALGSGTVRVFSEFEDSLTALRAKAGLSKEEMKKVGDFALEMGAKTVFSATEATQAMVELAASGLSVSDSMELLPSVMDAAAASGENLKLVADGVTDILDAFQLPTKEARDVLNTLNRATLTSSATFSSLVQSFQNVGGTAKMAGLSLEETAAVIAIFHENGIKGAEAGTQLRAMLNNMFTREPASAELKRLGVNLSYTTDEIIRMANEMGKPTIGKWSENVAMSASQIAKLEIKIEATKKKIKSLEKQASRGEDVDATLAMARKELEALEKEFSGRFVKKKRFIVDDEALAALGLPTVGQIKPIDTIIKDIAKKIEGMTETERFKSIKTIAGVYGQLGLQALLSAGGISEMTKKMLEQASVEEIASQKMQSLSNTFNNFRGSIEALLITLFEPIAEHIIKPILLAMTALLNVITGILRGTITVKTILESLKETVHSVAKWFLKIIQSITGFEEADGEKSRLEQKLGIERLVTLPETLNEIGKQLKLATQIVFGEIRSFFSKGVDGIRSTLESAYKKVRGFIENFFKQIAESISPRKQIEEFKLIVGGGIGIGIAEEIEKGFEDKPFVKLLKRIRAILTKLFSDIKNAISRFAKAVRDFLKKSPSEIIKSFQSWLASIFDRIKTEIENNPRILLLAGGAALAFIAVLKTGFIGGIIKLLTGVLLGGGSGLFGLIASIFPKILELMFSGSQWKSSDILNLLLTKSPFALLLSVFNSGLFQPIFNALRESSRVGLFAAVSTAFSTIVDGIREAFPRLVDQIRSVARSFGGFIADAVLSMFDFLGAPAITKKEKQLAEKLGIENTLENKMAAIGAKVQELYKSFKMDTSLGQTLTPYLEALERVLDNLLKTDWKTLIESFVNFMAIFTGARVLIFLGQAWMFTSALRIISDVIREFNNNGLEGVANLIKVNFERITSEIATSDLFKTIKETIEAGLKDFIGWVSNDLPKQIEFIAKTIRLAINRLFISAFNTKSGSSIWDELALADASASSEIKKQMEREYEEIFLGAIEQGLDREKAQKLWDTHKERKYRDLMFQPQINAMREELAILEKEIPPILAAAGKVLDKVISTFQEISNSVRFSVVGDAIRKVFEPALVWLLIRPIKAFSEIDFDAIGDAIRNLLNLSDGGGDGNIIETLGKFFSHLNEEHPALIRAIAGALSLLSIRIFALGGVLRVGNLVVMIKELSQALSAFASNDIEQGARHIQKFFGVLILANLAGVANLIRSLTSFNPAALFGSGAGMLQNSPIIIFLRDLASISFTSISGSLINLTNFFTSIGRAGITGGLGGAIGAVFTNILTFLRGAAGLGLSLVGVQLMINGITQLIDIISTLATGDISTVVDKLFPAVASLIGAIAAFRIGAMLSDPNGFRRLRESLGLARAAVAEAALIITPENMANFTPEQVRDRLQTVGEAITKSLPKMNEVNPSVYKMKEQATLLAEVAREVSRLTANMPSGQRASDAVQRLTMVQGDIDRFIDRTYSELVQAKGKRAADVIRDRQNLLDQLRNLTERAHLAFQEVDALRIPEPTVMERLRNALNGLGNALTGFLQSEFVRTVRSGLSSLAITAGIAGLGIGIKGLIDNIKGVENDVPVVESILSGLASVFAGVVVGNPTILRDMFNGIISGVSSLLNVGKGTAVGIVITLIGAITTFLTVKGEGNLIEGVKRLADELGRLMGIVPKISELEELTNVFADSEALKPFEENLSKGLRIAFARTVSNPETQSAIKDFYDRINLGMLTGVFDPTSVAPLLSNALRSVTPDMNPEQVKETFARLLGLTPDQIPSVAQLILKPVSEEINKVAKEAFSVERAPAIAKSMQELISKALKEATPEQADILLKNIALDFSGLELAAQGGEKALENFVQSKIFSAIGKKILDLSPEKFDQNFGSTVTGAIFKTIADADITLTPEQATELINMASKMINDALTNLDPKDIVKLDPRKAVTDWIAKEGIHPTEIPLKGELVLEAGLIAIQGTLGKENFLGMDAAKLKEAADAFAKIYGDQLEMSFKATDMGIEVVLVPKVTTEGIEQAVKSATPAEGVTTSVKPAVTEGTLLPTMLTVDPLATANAEKFAASATIAHTEMAKMAPVVVDVTNKTQGLKDKFTELTTFLSAKFPELFGEKGSLTLMFQTAFGQDGVIPTLIQGVFGEKGVFVNGIDTVSNKLGELEKTGVTMANNIGAAFAPITGAMLKPFAEGIKRIGKLLIGAAGSDSTGMLSPLAVLGGTIIAEAEKLTLMDRGGIGRAGQGYLVGTGAQPELVIPNRPSTFIPNADKLLQMMGNTNVGTNSRTERPANVVIHITAEQDMDTTLRQVEKAMRLRNRRFNLRYE